ncbi:ArnT family glycosyltransferase [Desulfocurvus sp. DL9XJH121]
MNKLFTRLFTAAAFAPLFFLLGVLALQTVFALDSRALWFSDEIRYANVFEHVTQAGKWLVMYLNGVPYPDKPPVYFWFLAGLLPVFKAPVPALFMAGAALSGLLFLAATCALNRLVLRGGRETGLAAGLVLLTCFYFLGLTHYSRMDLLFAALITASEVCLFRALERERATGLAIAAFVLAGVATLTKGPLGLVFPLLTGLLYCLWRGRARRFFRRDVGLGLLACLLLLGAWVGAAWLGGERELVENIFYKQIYRRAVNASHHEQPFWHYFATLPAAWLPWTFVLAALPLTRLFSAGFWKGVIGSRKTADPGLAWLWIAALSGFILLSSLSTKIVVYLLPLFPPLALLTARALLGMNETGVRRLYLWIGGLFAFMALSLPFGNYFVDWPIEIKGLWWMALASALAAAILIRFARTMSPGGALLVLALVVTAWIQPLTQITLPSLDGAMSPKAQAETMGNYIDRGYTPVAYNIYSGVYTYYCGHNILETQDLELIERMTREQPRLVLGMQRKYWDAWENRPPSLRVVHEQWIVDRPYVLAVQDAATGRPTPEAEPEAAEPEAGPAVQPSPQEPEPAAPAAAQ